MKIEDFFSTCEVHSKELLEERLLRVRQGAYGAFVLEHETSLSALWIHINAGSAFLYWFIDPDTDHPGFCSYNARANREKKEIFFLQVGGVVADGFTVSSNNTVEVSAAIDSAIEYLATKERPTCIQWVEQ
jgi:hypothetical protein